MDHDNGKQSSASLDNLLYLADRYCGEAATEEETIALANLLRDSAESCRVFGHYMQLDSLLGDCLRGKRALQHVFEQWVLPVEDGSGDAAPASRAAESRQVAAAPVKRTWTLSLGVAFLVVGSTLAFMAAVTVPWLAARKVVENPPPPSEVLTAAAASVVFHVNPVWHASQTTAVHSGQAVPLGTRLHLTAGVVEVQFRNGASVMLRGPCKFELSNENGGHLSKGNLTAYVPRKAAGFTITAPRLVVVDLGTRFGVDVNERGVSEVHVFVGRVKASWLVAETAHEEEHESPYQAALDAERQPSRVLERVELSANEAAAFDSDKQQIVRSASDAGRFIVEGIARSRHKARVLAHDHAGNYADRDALLATSGGFGFGKWDVSPKFHDASIVDIRGSQREGNRGLLNTLGADGKKVSFVTAARHGNSQHVSRRFTQPLREGQSFEWEFSLGEIHPQGTVGMELHTLLSAPNYKFDTRFHLTLSPVYGRGGKMLQVWEKVDGDDGYRDTGIAVDPRGEGFFARFTLLNDDRYELEIAPLRGQGGGRHEGILAGKPAAAIDGFRWFDSNTDPGNGNSRYGNAFNSVRITEPLGQPVIASE